MTDQPYLTDRDTADEVSERPWRDSDVARCSHTRGHIRIGQTHYCPLCWHVLTESDRG